MTLRKRLLSGLADLALILYFVFALFPIAWMVILSLKPANQLFSTYFSFTPTLSSYRTVLGDSEGIPFVRFFVNSLVVSVGAVLLSLVVGLPAAYASSLRTNVGSLRQAAKRPSSKPVRVMRLRYTAGMIWSVSTLLWRSGTPMPVCLVNFSMVLS